jgi:hypothetical protein
LAGNGFYTYAKVRELDEGAKPIIDIAERENLHYRRVISAYKPQTSICLLSGKHTLPSFELF